MQVEVSVRNFPSRRSNSLLSREKENERDGDPQTNRVCLNIPVISFQNLRVL